MEFVCDVSISQRHMTLRRIFVGVYGCAVRGVTETTRCVFMHIYALAWKFVCLRDDWVWKIYPRHVARMQLDFPSIISFLARNQNRCRYVRSEQSVCVDAFRVIVVTVVIFLSSFTIYEMACIVYGFKNPTVDHGNKICAWRNYYAHVDERSAVHNIYTMWCEIIPTCYMDYYRCRVQRVVYDA